MLNELKFNFYSDCLALSCNYHHTTMYNRASFLVAWCVRASASWGTEGDVEHAGMIASSTLWMLSHDAASMHADIQTL